MHFFLAVMTDQQSCSDLWDSEGFCAEAVIVLQEVSKKWCIETATLLYWGSKGWCIGAWVITR